MPLQTVNAVIATHARDVVMEELRLTVQPVHLMHLPTNLMALSLVSVFIYVYCMNLTSLASHVHSPCGLRPFLSSTARHCSYTYTQAETFLFLTSFALMSGRRRPKAFHLPYTIDTGFHDKC